MKKYFIFLGFLLSFCSQGISQNKCFIAQENGKILIQEGDCGKKYPPGCDFSIVLSLMGFDAGILQDENHPEWPYKEGYETFLNVWKAPHVPRTWIVDSCVWYSGNIVEKLGFEKIKDYIIKFDYGNKDITGMNRTDWPGALLISPKEQVEFLQRVVDRKLPVSDKAYEMTQKIIFAQDLPGRWKLYGKSGIGEAKNLENAGWFIGWIEKGNRRIPFASLLASKENGNSMRARNEAINKLFRLINELEK